MRKAEQKSGINTDDDQVSAVAEKRRHQKRFLQSKSDPSEVTSTPQVSVETTQTAQLSTTASVKTKQANQHLKLGTESNATAL